MNRTIHGSVEHTAAVAKPAMRIEVQSHPLAAPGVRSCYNCQHRKNSIYQSPCDECLGSPIRNRSHFVQAQPGTTPEAPMSRDIGAPTSSPREASRNSEENIERKTP